ncbi:MAG: heavy-metal-associated domain-containing protein [Sphingobacteriales bacterium]|nr:heavy-metal-associated domain-containing protein [Sphingobacteriales bacterium]
MKKGLLTFIAFIGVVMVAQAQTKPVITATIKTPNAACALCKDRIETYLKRYDGVMEINVNYRKGETRVKYISDRTDIEQIKTAISNCGYDADDVPADAEAYNRLPKSCKKFADGGGHPKPKAPPVPPQQ